MKKIFHTLTSLILLLTLCSCSFSDSGRTIHTLHPGDGITEPETVIVTVPGETVIVTVPVHEGTTSPETQADDTNPVSVTTGAVTTSAPSTSLKPEFGYVLITDSKNLGKESMATLIYPALQNTGNAEIENKVNELLADIAFNDFTGNENCKDYEDKIASNITVSYTVTACDVKLCSPAFMSVRFEAEYTLSDSSDKYNFIYTHTINLSTGKEIKTKNLFRDFGSILTMLEEGKLTRGASTQDFDTLVDMKDTIARLRSGIAYGTLPKVYFTEDKLYVIIELDQKLGGWAEYSVPLSQVSSYLAISF